MSKVALDGRWFSPEGREAMAEEQRRAGETLLAGGRTLQGLAVAALNDLPDDVAARLGPNGEKIYNTLLKWQIQAGKAIDPDKLSSVMARPELEGIFEKAAAVESDEPFTAPIPAEMPTEALSQSNLDVPELPAVVVSAKASEPTVKERALDVLGDAKAFADTLPTEQVGLGMMVLGAVTGGPIKLAFNQGLDLFTAAVVGDDVQNAQDNVSKWLAGWSLDLGGEPGESPITDIDALLGDPALQKDAQHQVDGAGFGLELFGAATGLSLGRRGDSPGGTSTTKMQSDTDAGVRREPTAEAGGVPNSAAAEATRVGRWMSETEFNLMNQTGRVVEGAGGRTYVVNPANPGAFTGAGRGSSTYAEFNVPTGVLKPGSKPEWSVIPGPNVTTRLYGPPPAELAPATCIVCVIRNP